MATFKILEDYAEQLTPEVAETVRQRISSEYRMGLIDEDNYQELLDELRETIIDAGEQRPETD
jgi:hypothetical protein